VKRPGRIILSFLDPIPPGLPRQQVMRELESRVEAATASLEREATGSGPSTEISVTRLDKSAVRTK
jgi:1-acyl-sn-glycerol-3-phosphate acyltransferase